MTCCLARGPWAIALMAALTLVACKDRDPDARDLPTDTGAPVDLGEDNDGDGYPEDVDCDDTDPNVNPGATERCNGVDDDCSGSIPTAETDADGDGVLECDEVCGAPPSAGPIATVGTCEYVPNATGTPFAPTVEWSWTHAMTDPVTGAFIPEHPFPSYPTYGALFQAPMVANITADEVPDIVGVFADFDEHHVGVLRLLSGDGTVEHASTRLQSHTNSNGTFDYGPYHYAGVAIGNIDSDANVEIVTLVGREDSTSLCWPAAYEVVTSGSTVTLSLEHVNTAGYLCGAHAPALADLSSDGDVEVIFGRNWLDGESFRWEGGGWGGRGWWGQEGGARPEGYWNSGYHAFAYDMDGDGTTMEVVAGSTVYTWDGADQPTDPVFCELGRYDGGTWIPAKDGYAAVADILRFSGDSPGEPEIVVTGNEEVAVFHGVPDYDPSGLARCLEIDRLPNDPALDPAVAAGLPSHPNCDTSRRSFGGPPNLSDFDGDGDLELGVAGACWYSVYGFDGASLERVAVVQTKDWSSASTGSTVFDFNGDGTSEIVFSDERAVYVWRLLDDPGLQPWERLEELMRDEDHKSFTIHEYPLVADVDGDGKAEILVTNTHIESTDPEFGLYALGALDDDWVSARTTWSQHAYYVTNSRDDLSVGYAAPNYAPYTSADYNSFRQQAPGSFGARAASSLTAIAQPPCQEGCGAITVYVQVANDSPHIAAGADTVVALYGESGASRTLIEWQEVGASVGPGRISPPLTFVVAGWDAYDRLVAVVDDPDITGFGFGTARECDETDNETVIPLTGICP